MADEANDDAAWKRKKGTYAGLGVIAFALIGAIFMYVDDNNSMDYFKMMHAKDYAILHAVLWSLFGLGIILWHNRPPPDNSNTYDDPNDPYR
jgi:hypothetical protein